MVRPVGTRSRRAGIVLLLAVLLGAAMLMSLGTGAIPIPPGRVIAALLGQPRVPLDGAVVLNLRLPRTLLGVVVGAGLGLSGAALQGLFRNPLADAGLLGVSTGAALGAVAAIVLAGPLVAMHPLLASRLLLPACAFAGGLLATAAAQGLSRAAGQAGVGGLLLAGIAVNALAAAGTGFLVYLSDDRQLRDIVFWTMGSIATGGWAGIWLSAPWVALAAALLLWRARALNALLMGEQVAFHLGVAVVRTRRIVVVATALAVGACVAGSGGIGFVGLVVPHLVRLLAGPDHRVVLPGSALLGAALLLASDCLARTAVAPAELPIGLVTGAVGGPVFVWLLLRRARPA